jgi:predicted N-acetyltransferase YhbS
MHDSAAYQGDYARILEGYQVTAGQIQRDEVFVAEEGGQVLGFYSLANIEVEPELDLLFVADLAQARGVGSALFGHMRSKACELGISTVRIVSHPPAERFYMRMGAQRVGCKAPTGKVSWLRPVLVLELGVDTTIPPRGSDA